MTLLLLLVLLLLLLLLLLLSLLLILLITFIIIAIKYYQDHYHYNQWCYYFFWILFSLLSNDFFLTPNHSCLFKFTYLPKSIRIKFDGETFNRQWIPSWNRKIYDVVKMSSTIPVNSKTWFTLCKNEHSWDDKVSDLYFKDWVN